MSEETRVSLSKKPDDEFGPVGKTVTMLVIVVILYLLAATVTYWVPPSGPSETYEARDYVAALGVQHGQAYDILLSEEAQTGTGGSLSGGGGLFSFDIVGELSPVSSVRMGFTSAAGESYIFDIPVSKVRFLQQEASPSTVFYIIEQDARLSGSDNPSYISRGNFWLFKRGAVVKPPSIEETPAWQTAQSSNLGELLPELVYRVDVTLTPEQFQRYVG